MIGDWEILKILSEIRKRDVKVLGFQFPDGMKKEICSVAREIEKKSGAIVLLSADPCYGACDLREMPVDFLVHFGHAPIGKTNPRKVLFVEIPSDFEDFAILDQAMPRLSGPIGLLAPIQYVPVLPEVKRYLKERKKEVLIGEGDSRIAYPGQVLGCNFSAARSIADKVASFLYIGDGNFHPLGVALAFDKDVIVVDPLLREIRDMSELREKTLRRRHAMIAKASQASTFGVIISMKAGQSRVRLAKELKVMAEEKGKVAFLFYMDYVRPEFLLGFDVDAYISTACPRIAIDDADMYQRPILTPVEFQILLNEKKWEEYVLDEIT